MLTYLRIQGFRSLGSNLDADSSLRNVDALLRSTLNIQIDTRVKKNWPGHGMCTGMVTQIDQAESTLYHGKVVTVYTVEYDVDGATEDLEVEEIRPLLIVSHLTDRYDIKQGLAPAFLYLENRLTGNCQASYSCEHAYNIMRLFQAFDPSFAATSLTEAFVEELATITPIGARDLMWTTATFGPRLGTRRWET